MAWTQADVDTLKAAIARGVLTVRYADQTVTYQSTAAMLQALAVMTRAVAGAAGPPATARRVATHKGV